MKKIILLFSAFCLLLTLSCQKEGPERFGFSSAIEQNSRGLTLMAVNSRVDFIYLEGYISVQEGEVDVTLTDPDGIQAFTKHIESGEYFESNEIFKSSTGIWKLKYISKSGTGLIDLHVRV